MTQCKSKNINKSFLEFFRYYIEENNSEIDELLLNVIKFNMNFITHLPPEEQADAMIGRFYAYGGTPTMNILSHYSDNEDQLKIDVQSVIDNLSSLSK